MDSSSSSSAEVPQHFTCPISLQIMKNPVTIITGITYDRDSIERWLSVSSTPSAAGADDDGPPMPVCPVTKQPLPTDCQLTPNHTLRRLIQAWCVSDAAARTRTRTRTLDELLRRLALPHLQLEALERIAALAGESEGNRRCLLQSAVPKAVMGVIASSKFLVRIEAALNVLHYSLRPSADDLKPLVDGDGCIIDAITWFLLQGDGGHNRKRKVTATLFLKSTIVDASPALLEQLTTEFFRAVLSVIGGRISPQATKAALQILLHACSLGRNRCKIVAVGGVREVVELELAGTPDKRTTELSLGVLRQLCSSAEGRAELVGHAAGIAAVAKRILRVSAAADEEGVGILYAVGRWSATREVVEEMASAGAVAKLCLVLQANCSSEAREKARWVLRLHSRAWKDSDACLQTYLSLSATSRIACPN